MIFMFHFGLLPVLKLERDGDFMYLVADAAALAVSSMTLAVTLVHFHLLYSNSLCCLRFSVFLNFTDSNWNS